MSTVFLPDPTQLCLICLSVSDPLITMVISTTRQEALCPLCRRSSRRVHSRYQRALADRPWSGVAVRLRRHVRRFFCDNVACRRRILTERIATVAAPSARRTTRLAAWFMQVAFALGGAPGPRWRSWRSAAAWWRLGDQSRDAPWIHPRLHECAALDTHRPLGG